MTRPPIRERDVLTRMRPVMTAQRDACCPVVRSRSSSDASSPPAAIQRPSSEGSPRLRTCESVRLASGSITPPSTRTTAPPTPPSNDPRAARRERRLLAVCSPVSPGAIDPEARRCRRATLDTTPARIRPRSRATPSDHVARRYRRLTFAASAHVPVREYHCQTAPLWSTDAARVPSVRECGAPISRGPGRHPDEHRLRPGGICLRPGARPCGHTKQTGRDRRRSRATRHRRTTRGAGRRRGVLAAQPASLAVACDHVQRAVVAADRELGAAVRQHDHVHAPARRRVDHARLGIPHDRAAVVAAGDEPVAERLDPVDFVDVCARSTSFATPRAVASSAMAQAVPGSTSRGESVASQPSASVGSRASASRAVRNVSWFVRDSSARRALPAWSHSHVTTAANVTTATSEPAVAAATIGRLRTNRLVRSATVGVRTETGRRCTKRRTSSPSAATD